MRRRRPREPFTFFVDECLGGVDLASALGRVLADGETLKQPTSGALDEDWLPSVGRHGWICISKDRAMQRRTNHLGAIIENGVALFTVGEANGAEHIRRIVSALPTMRRIARTTDVAFIARIEASGVVSVTYEGGEKLPRAKPVKPKIHERAKK